MKDRTIAIIASLFITVVIAFQVVLSLVPEETLLPGDPPLYLISIVGSIFI